MSSRKLQAEIDRVLKRISEGIVDFGVTWDKVQGAPTPNLKSKYETDLKKEIKKLQRYRDQIKSWASSSDVKHKRPLLEARRQIEHEMERFKVLEKETKTKAYSKEGLVQAARQQLAKTDANTEIFEWLLNIVDQLEEQTEQLEEQLEACSGKKRMSQRAEDIQTLLDQHQWHIDQLREAKRRIETREVLRSQLEEIKDDIEYYLDDHQDPDFFFDELLYDVLDEEPPEPSREPSPEPVPESVPEPEPATAPKKKKTKTKTKTKTKKVLKTKSKTKTTTKVLKTKKSAVKTKTKATVQPTPVVPKVKRKSTGRADSEPSTLASIIKSNQGRKNIVDNSRSSANKEPSKPVSVLPSPAVTKQPAKQLVVPPTRTSPVVRNSPIIPNKDTTTSSRQSPHVSPLPRAASDPAHPHTSPLVATSQHPDPQDPSSVTPGAASVAAAAVVADQYAHTLKMLEPSLKHIPEPQDSERQKHYAPRNPFRTPPYFPSAPAPVFDDPAVFEKFSADTLFFIFYFQQGTPHQYLAARELKKQSWRYHKHHFTWFQRHDDPELTTDDYEKGAYVSFDYENLWRQRINEDFTFEYRHLEDELSVPVSSSL